MFVVDLFESAVDEQTVHGFNKPGTHPEIVQHIDPNDTGEFYILPHFPPRFQKKVEFLARFHHVPLHHNKVTHDWYIEDFNKEFVRDIEYVLSAAGYGALGLAESSPDEFRANSLRPEHYEVVDPTKDEDDRSRRHYATNDLQSAQRIADKLGLAVIKVISPKKSVTSHLFAFEAKGTKLSAAEKKLNPGVNLNELIGRHVWVIVPEYPHIAKSAKVLRVGESGLVHVQLKTPIGNHQAVPDFFKGESKIAVRPSEIYVDIPPNEFKKKPKTTNQEELI